MPVEYGTISDINQKERNDDKFLKRLKVALDWYVSSSIPGLKTGFNRPVTVEIH